MSSGPIGEIPILITGDLSQLQPAFDQAASMAEAAGAQIAGAFTDGAGAATNAIFDFDAAVTEAVNSGSTLGEAIQIATDQMNAASTQAENLGEGLDTAASAASGAVSATEDASSSLEDLAGAAVAAAGGAGGAGDGLTNLAQSAGDAEPPINSTTLSLGNMLAVGLELAGIDFGLQALKDFGESAIAASDNIARTTISLTALTGSAEDAQVTIAELEDLAKDDALSIPQLDKAAVRMQAMLGPSTDVVAVMSAVADAAAVMQIGIEAAGNAFDRVASSSTITQRQLQTLGLTLEQLATAAGTTTDAIGGQGGLWSQMDETQHVQVLIDALSRFKGIAEDVAANTIGGQWKSAMADWQDDLARVGDAFAPVLDALAKLANALILPALSDFAELIGDAAKASTDFGEALTQLAGPIEDFLSAITPDVFKDFVDAISSNVIPGLNALGEQLNIQEGNLKQQGDAWTVFKEAMLGAVAPAIPIMQTLTSTIQGLTNTGPQLDAMNKVVADSFKNLQTETQKTTEQNDAFKQSMADVSALGAVEDGVQALINKQQQLDDAYSTAMDVATMMWQKYQDGAATIDDVNRAQAALEQAMNAATSATKDQTAAQKELQKEQDASNQFVEAANQLWQTIPASYDDYIETLSAGGQTAEEMLKSVQSEIDKAGTLMQSLTGAPLDAVKQWSATLQQSAQSLQDYAASDAWEKLALRVNDLAIRFPQQVAEMTGPVKDLIDELVTDAQNVPDALNKIDPSKVIEQALTSQQKLDQSTQQLGDHLQQAWEKWDAGATKAASQEVDIVVPLEQRLPAAIYSAVVAASDLNQAFAILGVTMQADGDAGSKKLMAINTVLDSQSVTLSQVDAAWSSASGTVDKLARNDLPAATAAYDELINKLQELGAPIGQIYTDQEKLLNLEIQSAEQTGTDATAQIVQLTNIKIAQQALADQAALLGNAYATMMQDFTGSFDTLAQNLGNDLVNGKGFYTAWHDTLNKLEGEIVTDLAKTALDALRDAILANTNAFQDLGKIADTVLGKITGIFGGGGGSTNLLAPATQAVGATGNPATIATGATNAATGGASSSSIFEGLFSGLGSSVIGGIISGGLPDLLSGLGLSHQTNVEGEIEQNTRYAYILQQQNFPHMWNDAITADLDDIKEHIWHVADLLLAGTGGGGTDLPTIASNTGYMVTDLDDMKSHLWDVVAGMNSLVVASSTEMVAVSTTAPNGQQISITAPITINGATDPGQVAQQVAQYLMSVSAKFQA